MKLHVYQKHILCLVNIVFMHLICFLANYEQMHIVSQLQFNRMKNIKYNKTKDTKHKKEFKPLMFSI